MIKTATTAPELTPQEHLNLRAQAIKVLIGLPLEDALGVACSFLELASVRNPSVVRRVLNEPVVKQGFRGTSLLQTLNKACR